MTCKFTLSLNPNVNVNRSRLGWEMGNYANFQIKVYREFGNYEEEYLNVAYLDFNEAKVRGLDPDTFYKFQLAGLIVDKDGGITVGPFTTITARTIGPGFSFQPGTPYSDGSGFAAQISIPAYRYTSKRFLPPNHVIFNSTAQCGGIRAQFRSFYQFHATSRTFHLTWTPLLSSKSTPPHS